MPFSNPVPMFGDIGSRTDPFDNYFQTLFFFLYRCFGLENNSQLQPRCFCSYYWTITKQILIILMTTCINETLTFKPITQILWIISVQASEFEMTFSCLRKINNVPFKSVCQSWCSYTITQCNLDWHLWRQKKKTNNSLKSSNKAQYNRAHSITEHTI